MMSDSDFTTLSDDRLITEIKRLVSNERHATAAVVRSLAEIDARRLYLREGSPSLFAYCTQVLHLAEGAAYNRIQAARAARRFPAILDRLGTGEVTLTSVRLLAPHLTDSNVVHTLELAKHRPKREVEALVASLHPRPDLAPAVRKLPSHTNEAPTPVMSLGAFEQPNAPLAARPLAPSPAPKPQSLVQPLAPERYKVQFTVSRLTHDKLRHAQDLLRHSIPNGDPAEIFDRALSLLVQDLERRKLAQVARPRPSPHSKPGRSRHIPASVRRDVWRRDGGRCAFRGNEGRCGETAFLEFHHVEPYAAGGTCATNNIQLRCRAHNQFEAMLFFGVHSLVREEAGAWFLHDIQQEHSPIRDASHPHRLTNDTISGDRIQTLSMIG